MTNFLKYIHVGILALVFGVQGLFGQAFATRFVVTETDGISPIGTNTLLRSGVLTTLRVTAIDDSGEPVTSYARNVTVSLPVSEFPNSQHIKVLIPRTAFALSGGGFADFDITPLHAGTANRRIAVTDGNIATYNANLGGEFFTIAPDSFSLAHSGTDRSLGGNIVVEGSNSARVYARNSNGEPAIGYLGSVTITEAVDPDAETPPDEPPAVIGSAFITSNGMVDNVTLTFPDPDPAYQVDITDGVTTTLAAHTILVRELIATPGIAAASAIQIDGSLRPGNSISVAFDLKAAEDAPIESTDTLGTLSSIRIFNNNFSFTYYSNSSRTTPGSDAEDGARASVNFVIPENIPPGAYTMRINTGLVGPNSNTAITIGGLPDLAIQRFDYAPGDYQSGDSVRFDMAWENLTISPGQTERNAMVPTTGGFAYRTEIHLSTNDIFGDEDDILVWTKYFYGNAADLSGLIEDYDQELSATGPLLTGQLASTTGEFLLPENRPGTYYLLAKINSSGGRTISTEGGTSTGFSSGFVEQIGPTPPAVLSDGNNIVLGQETQKLTILPRTSTETTRVSLTTTGAQVSGSSDNAVITRDGTYIVFESVAALAGANSSNGSKQIFRKNFLTGQVDLVSVGSSGGAANGANTRPSVSETGRYIVFESTSTDLEPSDSNGFSDIYLRDMQLGITRRLSKAGATQANSGSFKPTISANGRFVSFSSFARNLVATASTGISQVFLYDRAVSGGDIFDAAGNTSLTLVTANAGIAGTSASTNPRISGDGNFVVFTTKAPNLLGGLNSPFTQIVRWNRTTGTFLAVSANNGVFADGNADFASVNADGGQIVYVSRALNLTEDDALSGVPHIFRSTILNNAVSAIIRVNGAANEEPNNPLQGAVSEPDLGSFEPSISADGNLVTFASESDNLLGPKTVHHIDRTTYLSPNVHNAYDANTVADVYLADLSDPANPSVQRVSISSLGYEATIRTVGTTFTLRVPSSRTPTISPDGRFIVFTSDSEGHNGIVFGQTNFDYVDTNASRDIYVFDRKTGLDAEDNLPHATLRLPSSFSITAGSSVEMVVDASSTLAVARVEFYANNLLVGTSLTPAVANTGRYTFAWTAPLPGNGNTSNRLYELAAVAIDSAGTRSLVSNVVSLTVLPAVYGALPAPVITAPTVGANLTSLSSVQLAASVTDDDGNLVGLQFYVNGVAVGSELLRSSAQTTPTVNFATAWQPTSGVSTVVAVARDSVGNRVMSAPVTINVIQGTGSAPTVTLTSPGASSIYLGAPINFRATASDDGAVASVTFLQNGTVVAVDNSAPYTATFTPTAVGAYQVYAIARDNFANETATALVAVNVVAVPPPTVTLAQPSPASITLGQSTGLSATAQSIAGTIASVEFYANGTLISTDDVAPFGFTFVPTSAISYELIAIATDSFGNTATSDVRTLAVAPRTDIDNIYDAVFGRLPTTDEITAAVGKSPGELAALLIQSNEYRDGDSELLLTNLAVFGVYPTQSELDLLREQRLTNETETDVTLTDALLGSAAYTQQYGPISNLSVVSTNQYNLIRAFALRSFQNLNGYAATSTTANLVAQGFYNDITTAGTGLGLSPGQALVNYVNANFAGGKTGATLNTLRVAGVIVLIGNERPTSARIAQFNGYSLKDIANYYLAGGSGALTTQIPLQSWRDSNFKTSANSGLAADSADSDADGIPNLLEYAFGTNPNAANAVPMVTGLTPNGQFLTLTFNRVANPGLTYKIQASNNLATGFSDTGVSYTGSSAGSVTHTDTVPVSSAGSGRFLRVVVSY